MLLKRLRTSINQNSKPYELHLRNKIINKMN